MQAGRLLNRRNTHQAFNLKPAFGPAEIEKPRQFRRRNPGFLRLFSGIHLNIEAHSPALTFEFAGQGTGEFLAIKCLDHIEQGHRVCGLVALERSDQAKFEIRVIRAATRPVLLRLLHPVLTEYALPGGEHRVDSRVRLTLGDSDELHRVRAAPCLLSRTFNTVHNCATESFNVSTFGHVPAI